MGLFRRKFRVKARDSRGQKGEDDMMTPSEAVKFTLVENYDETKQDYDNLESDELRDGFKACLGEVAEAFTTSATMVDLQLIAMEDN